MFLTLFKENHLIIELNGMKLGSKVFGGIKMFNNLWNARVNELLH